MILRMTRDTEPTRDSAYHAGRGEVELAEVAVRNEGLPQSDADQRVGEALLRRGLQQLDYAEALKASNKPHVAARFSQRAERNIGKGLSLRQ